jgi:ketosteroid isomerase-like protein
MKDEDAILAANSAYYRAFRTGDDALMSRVWHVQDVTCIHPGWPPIIGRAPVLESYRQIMLNPNQEPVRADEEQVSVLGDWARVLCRESITGAQLAATNLFVRTPDGWRLVHHHASPMAMPVRRREQMN